MMDDASINQTSVESLHAEHADLGREVARLRKLLAGEFEWPDLEAALSSFARRLDEHFEFEESGGYFSEVLELDPNRRREVEQLHDEHTQMRDQVREARHQIVDGTEREKMRSFLNNLLALQRDHETRETQLLMVTFNTDTGGGD